MSCPRRGSGTKMPRRHGTCLFLLPLIGLLLWTFPAGAHPPTELSLAYDLSSQTLTVQITHAVSAPSLHYISRVTISKDGRPLVAVDYNRQPEQAAFSYSHPVEAAVGTVLEVTVTCNLFGSRTVQLAVDKVPIRVSSRYP